MELDLEKLVQTIRDLAVDQGKLAVDRWPSAVPLALKNRRDFVTKVDLEIEHNIKDALRKAHPDHGLSGEETGDEGGQAEYQWLIDPIDGTKYYAGQASLFSVSIALLFRDEPVLGVVYNAAADQVFHAIAGGGAFLGDQRLRGSTVANLSQVIIALDTAASDQLSDKEREWFESKLVMLTRRLYRVRALGQGSLAACWLASGAMDAYLDLTGYIKPQDLAAGRIIMKEAGVRVEYMQPEVGPRRLLAAPPAVFSQLRELLAVSC